MSAWAFTYVYTGSQGAYERQGSGETARMRMLVWDFAAYICD